MSGIGLNLQSSHASYPMDPKKQAVVDRYNALRIKYDGEKVDWGMLFAELVEAYCTGHGVGWE